MKTEHKLSDKHDHQKGESSYELEINLQKNVKTVEPYLTILHLTLTSTTI